MDLGQFLPFWGRIFLLWEFLRVFEGFSGSFWGIFEDFCGGFQANVTGLFRQFLVMFMGSLRDSIDGFWPFSRGFF